MTAGVVGGARCRTSSLLKHVGVLFDLIGQEDGDDLELIVVVIVFVVGVILAFEGHIGVFKGAGNVDNGRGEVSFFGGSGRDGLIAAPKR